MGLFDTFIPSKPVICPNCSQEIEGNLQSKELRCLMDTYKQGELLEIKGPEVRISIKDGWVEAHTSCDKCKSYVRFKIIIENGFWTETEKWEDEEK
ncbi:MAG: hypothetical protein HY517_02030 [Candidatus Aenigmarchaeota archaeon]|nr:hypothetical protein [Candidatus Aenigmarchaeota archaeon]